MINETAIISIIPPVVTALLAWVLALRKSRMSQNKLILDIQTKSQIQAIELITKSEEKLRNELKFQLNELKQENAALKEEIDELNKRLSNNGELIHILKTEIEILTKAVNFYEGQIKVLTTSKKK